MFIFNFFMKRYFLPFTTALFFLGLSLNSYASSIDNTNTLLIPCKDSVEFNRGFEGIIEGLEKRKEVYEKGTLGYDEIEGEIGRTRDSFEVYKNCICGALDGLPHLIADGGTKLYGIDTSGDLLVPGAIFIYIAGYIGWAGRRYLIYVRGLEKELSWKREIIIDVPAASYIMLTCFLWPLEAIKAYFDGTLIMGDCHIYKSGQAKVTPKKPGSFMSFLNDQKPSPFPFEEDENGNLIDFFLEDKNKKIPSPFPFWVDEFGNPIDEFLDNEKRPSPFPVWEDEKGNWTDDFLEDKTPD